MAELDLPNSVETQRG